MYRISIHTRAHDFAMMLAGLVALILIIAGLIIAAIASDVAEQDLSQRVASPSAPMSSPNSQIRD